MNILTTTNAGLPAVQQTDITYTVLAGFRLLVGLLLVGNQRQIVNFIERKRKQ
jgi:hypothetical protein